MQKKASLYVLKTRLNRLKRKAIQQLIEGKDTRRTVIRIQHMTELIEQYHKPDPVIYDHTPKPKGPIEFKTKGTKTIFDDIY